MPSSVVVSHPPSNIARSLAGGKAHFVHRRRQEPEQPLKDEWPRSRRVTETRQVFSITPSWLTVVILPQLYLITGPSPSTLPVRLHFHSCLYMYKHHHQQAETQDRQQVQPSASNGETQCWSLDGYHGPYRTRPRQPSARGLGRLSQTRTVHHWPQLDFCPFQFQRQRR